MLACGKPRRRAASLLPTCGDPEVAEQYLPIIHLVFEQPRREDVWLIGIHHGVSHAAPTSPGHLLQRVHLRASTGPRSTPFNRTIPLDCSASRATPPKASNLCRSFTAGSQWRHPTSGSESIESLIRHHPPSMNITFSKFRRSLVLIPTLAPEIPVNLFSVCRPFLHSLKH